VAIFRLHLFFISLTLFLMMLLISESFLDKLHEVHLFEASDDSFLAVVLRY
jgi:hypothetical protein